MKLEVGMYVRTKYGISKIDEDRRIDYGIIKPVIDILKEEAILKASHNIIDLIEVGDYVNGFIVNDIVKENEDIRFNLVGQLEPYLHNEDIKSIVTKEMFSSISYEVSK